MCLACGSSGQLRCLQYCNQSRRQRYTGRQAGFSKMKYSLQIDSAQVTQCLKMSHYVTRTNIASPAATICMDVHNQAMSLVPGSCVRIGVWIDDHSHSLQQQQQQEEVFNYHSTGIVYSVDHATQRIEASFGGLLMSIVPAAGNNDCESWVGKRIDVYMATV